MIHPKQMEKNKKIVSVAAVIGLSLVVAGAGCTNAPAAAPEKILAPVAPVTTPTEVPTSTPVIATGAVPSPKSTSAPTPAKPTPAPQPAKENRPATESAPTSATTSAPAPASVYKDGIYSATGNYGSPAGAETIGVTITLKADVIMAATVEVNATNPRSKIMQEDFAANYKPLVIGKKIDDVRLTKVSGSSLTSTGFNEALEKIKVQAK